MSNIKMGLTIEEAAECTGIGRNTMRKLVDWGQTSRPQGRKKSDYPQGYFRAIYERQSGKKPAQ